MSEKTLYGQAKEAFVENGDVESFVTLDTNRLSLQRLLDYYKKPFKFIVIHGEPGVGKSMLIKKYASQIGSDDLVVHYKPFFSLDDFKKSLALQLFGDEKIDP
ncbi:MAG: ATP-binding protein, partial [Epsilonproteobacteria bacterium]|nr:ATP-binding protein [Campylobacterota bacterium]